MQILVQKQLNWIYSKMEERKLIVLLKLIKLKIISFVLKLKNWKKIAVKN